MPFLPEVSIEMEKSMITAHPLLNNLLLLFGTLLYFFVNIQAVVIPGTLFDSLQQDLNASAAAISLLGASYMYVYAFGQLLAGLLADRYGGFWTIFFGGILFSVGSLLFPFGTHVWSLCLCRILIGLGASSVYLSLVKEYSKAFTRNFAPMLGVMILVGYSGGILAGAPFLLMLPLAGNWQNLLFFTGVVTFLCWTCLAFLLFSGDNIPKNDLPPKKQLSNLIVGLRNWNNLHIFILAWSAFGIYYVIQTVIGKKFLEDFCHFSASSAAWWISVIGIVSAVFSFLTPILSRFCGNQRRGFILFCGFGILLPCLLLVLMIFLNHASLWIPILFCIMTGAANVVPIQVALLHETNPPEILGTLVSIMNFGAYFSVAVLGSLGGFLMDIFPPQRSGEVLVYGRNSYLAVFILLFLVSCWGVYSALQIRYEKILE